MEPPSPAIAVEETVGDDVVCELRKGPAVEALTGVMNCAGIAW